MDAIWRSIPDPPTNVVTVAGPLFAVLVSAPSTLTDAVLVKEPGRPVDLTLVSSWIWVNAPLSNPLPVQVIVVVPEQLKPLVAVALTKSTADGRVSVTVTMPVVGPLPTLDTVMVYVRFC